MYGLLKTVRGSIRDLISGKTSYCGLTKRAALCFRDKYMYMLALQFAQLRLLISASSNWLESREVQGVGGPQVVSS